MEPAQKRRPRRRVAPRANLYATYGSKEGPAIDVVCLYPKHPNEPHDNEMLDEIPIDSPSAPEFTDTTITFRGVLYSLVWIGGIP